MPPVDLPPWLLWPLGLALAAAGLVWRMRRMRRLTPLKLERLWVVPAFYAGVVALVVWAIPPGAHDLPWMALSLAVGAAIGWVWGRLMHIHIDPETHALNKQASPAALLLVVALVAVRIAAKSTLNIDPRRLDMSDSVVDIAFVFPLGLLTMTRLEMYLRTRRMLDALKRGL